MKLYLWVDYVSFVESKSSIFNPGFHKLLLVQTFHVADHVSSLCETRITKLATDSHSIVGLCYVQLHLVLVPMPVITLVTQGPISFIHMLAFLVHHQIVIFTRGEWAFCTHDSVLFMMQLNVNFKSPLSCKRLCIAVRTLKSLIRMFSLNVVFQITPSEIFLMALLAWKISFSMFVKLMIGHEGLALGDNPFFTWMNIFFEWIIFIFFEWINSLNEYFAFFWMNTFTALLNE